MAVCPPCPGPEHPKRLGCDCGPLTDEELVQWARGRPGPDLGARGSQPRVPLFTGRIAYLFSPSLPQVGGAPLLLSRLKDDSLEHFSSCLDCKLSSDSGHILTDKGGLENVPSWLMQLQQWGEAHP